MRTHTQTPIREDVRSDVLLCKLRVSYTDPSDADAHSTNTHPTHDIHTVVFTELAPSSVLARQERGGPKLAHGDTKTMEHGYCRRAEPSSYVHMHHMPMHTCGEMRRSVFCGVVVVCVCVSSFLRLSPFTERRGIFFIGALTHSMGECWLAGWLNEWFAACSSLSWSVLACWGAELCLTHRQTHTHIHTWTTPAHEHSHSHLRANTVNARSSACVRGIQFWGRHLFGILECAEPFSPCGVVVVVDALCWSPMLGGGGGR